MNEVIFKSRQSGRNDLIMKQVKTTILDGKSVFIAVLDQGGATRIKNTIKKYEIPCEIEEAWDPDKTTGLSGKAFEMGTYDELTGKFYPPAPVIPKLTGLLLKPIK